MSSTGSRKSASGVLILLALVGALVVGTGSAGAATTHSWNFQQRNTPVPSGWSADHGDLFQSTRGYGWKAADGLSRQCADRNAISDQVRDTFCHAQARFVKQQDGTWKTIDSPASWRAAIPDGEYSVTVIVGESKTHPSAVRHSVQVEGVSFHNQVTTSASKPFVEVTRTVTVAGGSLDVSFDGGTMTKLVAISAVTGSTTTTTTVSSTTTTTASSGGTALKFYDGRATIDGTNYNRNNSYVMPVSDLRPYTYKNAQMKITVFSKASTLNTPMQICAWQRGPNGEWQGTGTDEACSPLRGSITAPGTYTFELPAPSTWWAKSGKGNYDWGKKSDAVGIMVKDGTYSKPPLMNYKNCGAACHPKGESYVKQHVPIDFRAEITFYK